MTDLLIILIKTVFALAWLLALTLFLTWVERKESAVLQDRIGANRASILGLRLFGIFQPVADALKMMFKEDFVPSFSQRFLHTLAPFLSFFFVAVTIAAVPFGPNVAVAGRTIPLQIADLNVGILFVFAMFALGIYGILLGGWGSNNRFALLGSFRGAAQLISAELAIGLSMVGLIMVYPSLSLSSIVHDQGEMILGFLPRWGVFLQPLGFAVFFVAALIETKRVPFDIPEGESEIIGFFAEYGGLKWGLFMMTDFMEIIIISCLLATLFFGGWQVPWLRPDGFHFPWGTDWILPRALVVILQVAAFNFKVLFFCWLQILIRWTYPRLRYDQLLKLGWKLLIPLSAANILATGLVMSVLR
jgi:NADH-quinone oxidoreductase subunit H